MATFNGREWVPCATTIIKNISGAAQVLGFLPPHGLTLAAGEEKQILGDVWAQCRTPRHLQALERALDGEVIEIVRSPGGLCNDSSSSGEAVVS